MFTMTPCWGLEPVLISCLRVCDNWIGQWSIGWSVAGVQAESPAQVPLRRELDRLLETGPFAEALRVAIRGSGLSLSRIRDRLGERGVVLSPATLSYWQSGRSRPERRGSLVALRALEELLELGDGALAVLLAPARSRDRRAPVELSEIGTMWPSESVDRALREVDTRWEASLRRLSLHERVEMDAAGRISRVWVRQVVRATADGPDRWTLFHHRHGPGHPLPLVQPLRGCGLGAVHTDPDAELMAAELLFPRALARGETMVTEYALVERTPGPPSDQHRRRFRSSVREYVLEVEFTAPALPSRCTQLWAPEGEGAEFIERRLEVVDHHRAVLVALDTGPGQYGVRWEF